MSCITSVYLPLSDIRSLSMECTFEKLTDMHIVKKRDNGNLFVTSVMYRIEHDSTIFIKRNVCGDPLTSQGVLDLSTPNHRLWCRKTHLNAWRTENEKNVLGSIAEPPGTRIANSPERYDFSFDRIENSHEPRLYPFLAHRELDPQLWRLPITVTVLLMIYPTVCPIYG